MAINESIASRLMADLQRDLGLTQAQAAGVVGNLAHESGGFNTLQEISPIVAGSRGGFGYAQWTGPRRRNFERFASQNGLDPASYEANYGFLLHEVQTDPYERSQFFKVLEADTAEQAAEIVSQNYLRPGIPHMASRKQFASQLADITPSAPPTPQDRPSALDAINSLVRLPQTPQTQSAYAPEAPSINDLERQTFATPAPQPPTVPDLPDLTPRVSINQSTGSGVPLQSMPQDGYISPLSQPEFSELRDALATNEGLQEHYGTTLTPQIQGYPETVSQQMFATPAPVAPQPASFDQMMTARTNDWMSEQVPTPEISYNPSLPNELLPQGQPNPNLIASIEPYYVPPAIPQVPGAPALDGVPVSTATGPIGAPTVAPPIPAPYPQGPTHTNNSIAPPTFQPAVDFTNNLFGGFGALFGGSRQPMSQSEARGILSGRFDPNMYGSSTRFTNNGTARNTNAMDRLKENRAKREAAQALGL